jgi:hypothetical protein
MQDQWQSAYPGFTGKAIEAMTLFAGRSPEQGSYSAMYVFDPLFSLPLF